MTDTIQPDVEVAEPVGTVVAQDATDYVMYIEVYSDGSTSRGLAWKDSSTEEEQNPTPEVAP